MVQQKKSVKEQKVTYCIWDRLPSKRQKEIFSNGKQEYL